MVGTYSCTWMSPIPLAGSGLVVVAAVAVALFPPSAGTPAFADAALWVAVVLTVVSGIDLVAHARRRPPAPGGTAPTTQPT